MINLSTNALNSLRNLGFGSSSKNASKSTKVSFTGTPTIDDANATHKRVKSSTNAATNSSQSVNLSINSSVNSQISGSNTSSNSSSSLNFSLVTDKSKAVGTSLGYGIDKDGYYTSDFNEAAGIPGDYKIHSSTMESLMRIRENDRTHACEVFKSLDIAATIGNAYKVLSQVVGESVLNSKDSFTMDDIAGFAQGYKYVKSNLEVNKTYDINEFMDEVAVFEKRDKFGMDAEYMGFLFYNQSSHTSGALKPTSNIFDNNNGGRESELGGIHWDTTASKYTNADGSISKGGLLIGVLNANSHLIEEEAEHIELESAVQEAGDNEWLKNYKDPIMQLLEEILARIKEQTQKALQKQRENMAEKQSVDIKA